MEEKMTEEELFGLKDACQKKYEKLEMETIKKALTGEIGTNMKMVEALKALNYEYHSEIDDYDPYASDLNPQTIENFKNAEERGENVIQCAREHLEMFAIADKAMNKLVYTNEDGKVCDEFGNPLSEDGEHRVFEAVKGNGGDSAERGTFRNPTTLGVIKGDK